MGLTPEQIEVINKKKEKYQKIVDSIDEQLESVALTSRAENSDDKLVTKSNKEILETRAYYSNLINALNKRLKGEDNLGQYIFKNALWGTY